jgi:hypothetical protein
MDRHMNRAYIARRVTPDEYCFRRHLEEGAFDSFEEAEKYVKSLVEEARTDDSSDRLIPSQLR